MSQAIYLDYNATTPIDTEVAAEMLRVIEKYYGNPSSTYVAGCAAKNIVNQSRAQVAEFINAQTDEIVFTSCATESNNLAIRGVLKRHCGKHIITSSIEHPAVIEVCRHLETQDYEVTYLSVDKWGRVNPVDVEKAIQADTALISIMHANNETGSVQPIEQIARIAKKHGVLFHTDASQSAGKIDMDVSRLGVDLLTIAGHKIYAPKGIGALYIKKGVEIENIMYGAGHENGVRPGTENVIHIAALGKACEVACRDFEQNVGNMKSTRDYLLQGLEKLFPGRIYVHADLRYCLPNTLSVAIANVDAHALVANIGDKVMISTGSACHEGAINISSVLKAMMVNDKVAASTLRISTGKKTTFDEIDYVLNIFRDFV